MNREDVYGLAKALALAGGVISLLVGVLDLAGAAMLGLRALDFVRPALSIAVGIVALALLNELRNEGVAVVFVILGFIAGGAGGFLVGIAGLACLAAEYLMKQPAQAQPAQAKS
jgi:hypothetical protein